MTLYNAIADYRSYMDHFNRHEFSSYFKEYKEAVLPVIESVTDADAAAEEMLCALEADWNAAKGRRRRNLLRENDHLLLCCFLNPAAMKSELPAGPEVAGAIKAVWDRKFPDYTYRIGTYEDIMKGFEPRIFGMKISRD